MNQILTSFFACLLTVSFLFAADGPANENHREFFHGENVGKPILCGCSGRLERFDADGNLVWTYSREIGNMSDVQLLETETILYADADSVTEVTPDCKSVSVCCGGPSRRFHLRPAFGDGNNLHRLEQRK